MVLHGRIENGVVVLQEAANLPDGTEVTVVVQRPATQINSDHRVELPLVRSEHPGTLELTADRIADLLDDEHASAGH